MSVQELARTLDDARRAGRAVEPLSAAGPLGLEDAYAVQDEGLRLRGEAAAGWKMGLTSKAKMAQMGVSVPIMGVLTEPMRVACGGTLSRAGLIHPRVEPEVAFLLGRDLRGRVSQEEALAACSGVCAALEVIDSRYKDFKFTLADVVADNCSSSAFVLGPAVDPRGLELGGLAMALELGGKVAQSGSSGDIYGHPAASLAELAAMLDKRGRGLPAGCIVLAGAATAAVALPEAGAVRAVVAGLSPAVLQVV